MPINAKYIACAVLSVLPCMALAQDPAFCETITKVGNDAQKMFASFLGPRERGDYRSTLLLPGAESCVIIAADRRFLCEWAVSFTENSDQQARRLMKGLRDCFPKATHQVIDSHIGAGEALSLNSVNF